MTDFAAVDTGDPRDLVAMMDATDAWPAVQASRAWLLDQVTLHDGDLVVDAGCGPGTFGAEVPGSVIDVDASHVMLRETRVRRPDARVVLGDVADLPLRDGTAAFVHAERVLQWIGDPGRALGELHRVVAPGGWLGVTDTDWGTFRIDHPDPGAADRLAGAALGWVPHARVARDLPTLFTALGARDVRTRHDVVTITAWDPDDPAQRDGPPGLPLHSIAGEHASDVDAVADAARRRAFRAALTLVTVIGGRS